VEVKWTRIYSILYQGNCKLFQGKVKFWIKSQKRFQPYSTKRARTWQYF